MKQNEATIIKRFMRLLSDLVDGNIGIERIWPERRTWESDPEDGLRAWHARVCQAKGVDIMSNTLWNNWMREPKFREGLFENVKQGTTVVCILIYDPGSAVFGLRALDEAKWREQRRISADEMKIEIAKTLRSVKEIQDRLPESVRENLKIRLTHQAVQLAQIIRADERMLVATYLSGQTGGPSPTMQLRGVETTYFTKHKEQFKVMWKRGIPLSDKDFHRILGMI